MNFLTNCFVTCLLAACSTSGLQVGEDSVVATEDQARAEVGVVNGTKVPISQFPYMASYRVKGNLVGSGVIIDKQWILTTGYILTGWNVSDMEFRVGSGKYSSGGQVLTIEKIIIHEQFRLGSWDYDVAVVKVKPLKFGRKVKPIALGTQEVRVGMKGLVSGWGEKDKTGVASNELLAANVTIIPWKVCNDTFGPKLTSRMICSFDKTTGPCWHDFGDPLVIKNVVYGLYSGGCCTPGKTPVLYTYLPALHDWVQNKTSIAVGSGTRYTSGLDDVHETGNNM